MSSAGAPLHNVFVYGSFQEPAIVEVMLDRVPEMIAATLPGFHRYRLKGRLYPCIMPSETREVNGMVLMNLTNDELENLDVVEGSEYERVTVAVVRKDNSEKMTVKTYIWGNKEDTDMFGEWDFEEWKRLHMDKFKETFKEIIDWKKNPEAKTRNDFNHVLKEDHLSS